MSNAITEKASGFMFGTSIPGDPTGMPGAAMPAIAGCRSSLRARHGGPGYGLDYEVQIPANVTTTLVIPASVAADAPWPRSWAGALAPRQRRR